MPMLHDPSFRDTVRTRVQALRPDAARQLGQMRVDQMLWHVNSALENALGRRELEQQSLPLPKPILTWMVIHVPWISTIT